MFRSAALVSFALVFSGPLVADPPDSAVNPETGFIETVYSAREGSQYLIRYVEDEGPGTEPPATLETCSAGCAGARIAIAADGDSYVVWERDGAAGAVASLTRELSSGTWSQALVLSETNEDARNPQVAWCLDDAWATFESVHSLDTDVVVGVIADEPDPLGSRVEISTTEYDGHVDARIHCEAGHLWITWVDSSSHVGWSEYQTGSDSWTSPQFWSYGGSTIAAARAAIQEEVLGL